MSVGGVVRTIQDPSFSSAGVAAGSDEPSAAALFAIVWDTLVDMFGTAAVAALVRRATSRAATRSPELLELLVGRDDLEYAYTVPRAWSPADHGAPMASLRELMLELGRLLMELTGTVVVQQMEQSPELRACGLVWRVEEAN